MASIYYESISRKQAGVVFSAYKQKKINVPEEVIKHMYKHFVDVRGYNNNANQQDVYDRVKNCVQRLFEKNYAQAEKELMCAVKLECAIYTSKDIEALKKVI